MKKLFIVIGFAILLMGCQKKPVDKNTVLNSNDALTAINNDTLTVTNNNDISYNQNDLVYRDYGIAVKLTGNSKVKISQINLDLKDETAVIYVVDLENDEVIKSYDYHPNQEIAFTPDTDGVYMVVAELSNGEIIDLTEKAVIEVADTTSKNDNGIILLK